MQPAANFTPGARAPSARAASDNRSLPLGRLPERSSQKLESDSCTAPPPTPHQGPRAVILLGPPKTGSTHLQSFLAANQANLRSFGWEWPRGVDGQLAGPKSYANLVGALTNRSCNTTFWTEAPTLTDAILSYCHGSDSEKAAFRGPPGAVLAAFRKEFRRIAVANRSLVLSAEVRLFGSPPPPCHSLACAASLSSHRLASHRRISPT